MTIEQQLWYASGCNPKQPMTRKRLRKMLKWFQDRSVHVRYEYRNSMGGYQLREITTTYDRFEIRSYSSLCHQLVMYKGQQVVFEQELEGNWDFIGLGMMEMINSGPRCYFSITNV